MYKLKRPPTAFVQRCRTFLVTTLATGCAIIIAMAFNPAYAQNITTVAGNNGLTGFAGDGLQATDPAVRLTFPRAVLALANGSILIADTAANRVRKVDVGGVITTVVGTGGSGWTGDNAPAISAQIDNPACLQTDTAGNIYICSAGAIRKVDLAGNISTIVGNGTLGNTGADGSAATAAQVGLVAGIAFDRAGNLFFTDVTYGAVRKIDTSGNIYRIAGTTGSGPFGADNVPALTELLSRPRGILVSADGSLIVAVENQNRVRQIVPGGNITTLVGNGTPSSTGDGAAATLATINRPYDVVADGAGGYLVSENFGHRVRKIAASGIITTIIGNGTGTNTGDGGLATAATIFFPMNMSRDSAGNIFIASQGGSVIRKIAAPPPPVPGPSVFNAYLNTTTATLGTITPAGEQTVPFGGIVKMTVTANPRHVLRVASNCDYVQTSRPIALVPIGTGASTYNVTVNGPCQMEATFTPLIPKTNVNTEAAANAFLLAVEATQNYTTPVITQTSSTVGQTVSFKAWVTDIAGVPYPSASNVITFKANGTAITGCRNVPLTLRPSDVVHIREAVCVTSFAAAGNSVITSEFAGDTYNFPAVSSGLNHSVSAAP